MAGGKSSRGAEGAERVNERMPQGSGMRDTMRKMQSGARISDIVLAVLFAVFAMRSHGGWAVFWWLSAAFCAVTAATSPMEKVFDWVQRRFLGVRRG